MAKIRASFNEKTGKWRWVPKVWHLKYSTSPSGSTYYITGGPGGHLRDISSPNELDALGFHNEQVAWGYALALTELYNVRVLPVVRWNGHPAYKGGIR